MSWISIKDRKPPAKVWVLVADASISGHLSPHIACRYDDDTWTFEMAPWVHEPVFHRVEFWQELPEVPQLTYISHDSPHKGD